MDRSLTNASLQQKIKTLEAQVERFNRIENDLRLSEARYRRVFEQSGAPLIIIANDMTILMANLEFEKLTGYTKAEIENKMKWTAFICDQDLEKMKRYHVERRRSTSQVPGEYECQVVNRGGQKKDIYVKVAMMPDQDQSIASFMDITERKLYEQELKSREAFLQKENKRLKSSIKERYKFGSIVGKSPMMQEVYERIILAAQSDENVIVYGESGTGKELVARAIHDICDRSKGPFIPVNCGAIPENLLESELFGYRKGAFTGAHTDKPGYFDQARKGSLFLDELGEINLNMQVKLLRVLDGHGFIPIGGKEIIKPDVRIIAATHQDLGQNVKKGKIREDFFYRIHIIPVYLPPLRDRKEDLVLLVDHFLSQYRHKKVFPAITGEMYNAMHRYDWPGNIRELQNTLHRYVTLHQFELMGISYSKPDMDVEQPQKQSIQADLALKEALDAYEKQYILKYLTRYKWHRGKAAAALGINRKTLFKKIQLHGILEE